MLTTVVGEKELYLHHMRPMILSLKVTSHEEQHSTLYEQSWSSHSLTLAFTPIDECFVITIVPRGMLAGMHKESYIVLVH